MVAMTPASSDTAIAPRWEELEPRYQALMHESVDLDWLHRWSDLASVVREAESRLSVATTVNTADAEAERAYDLYLDTVRPRASAAEHALKRRLIESGLTPADMQVPIEGMRAEVAIFSEQNLPLESDLAKLSIEYDKRIGAQTVEWEGRTVTLSRLGTVLEETDRDRREQAWRLGMARRLQDRDALNDLWARMLQKRIAIASNAGFGHDYRAYRWKQLKRFDYSPDDCKRFHEAIEQVVVPCVQRILARRRERMDVPSLRPWDLHVDLEGREPLRPFETDVQLKELGAHCFSRVDPALGGYFQTMRDEGLLDIGNRANKAPGGYCTMFPVRRRPFIFMNAVGQHADVRTLLHEGGHAFHVFESAHLPYVHQLDVPTEFAEVASMSMELLAMPSLSRQSGGNYSDQDLARAQIEHFEQLLTFWPYMAVVDAFQHWVYENPSAAAEPSRCDQTWADLWDRFMPGEDWSGLDVEKRTGWHRKLHIFQEPLYYIEYGLAQLGAVQIWINAKQDRSGAVQSYRRALALGGTKGLPDLFAAAGAELRWDSEGLRRAVEAVEAESERLRGSP